MAAPLSIWPAEPMAKLLDGPRLAPKHGAPRQLVVLLHGYGADGNDLIGLSKHWQELLPEAAFASPHAPERCTMSGAGYQWFPLARLDPHETARGVESAAPALSSFLDAELARYGLGPERLALVGFSQGTMMALHVGLRLPQLPAAIVGFSGLLVAPERLPSFPGGGPKLFLAHGDADQVIPPAALFVSAGALGRTGLTVQWHLTPGMGHGISPDSLEISGWILRNAFAGRLQPAAYPASSSYPR